MADPAGIELTTDDVGSPDFPLPGVFTGAHPVVDGRGRRDGHDDPELPPEGDPYADDYLIGDWYAPRPSRPLHSTRCTAIARSTGERCRRWAVIGFTKCQKHSGYGRLANLKDYREAVIERARLDLIRAAPYAVERLVDLARDPEVNPAVSLKASTEILDRVGVRGGTELDVKVEAAETSPAEVIRGRLARLAETHGLPMEPSTTGVATGDGAGTVGVDELAAELAGESEITDAEVLDD